MKLLSLLFLFAASCAIAQPPTFEVIAYSRTTTPGIPPGNSDAPSANNPFPVNYFIYVIVKKGTPVSIAGLCLKRQSCSAKLERVPSPVVVPHDVNVPTKLKDTLVRKTEDDVYQVILQGQSGAACENQPADLVQTHDVVVRLKSGESFVYGAAKTIVALSPAAAM
jgi:hypothetical protein